MKRIFAGIAILAGAATAPAIAADIGVSIDISQPGVYGRIDIGRVVNPPVLVYQQPVIISPTPVAVHRQPIYLHVPPGHARSWKNYCGRYQACGQPVYFVQDGWYRDVYVPAYHEHRGGHWDSKREKKYHKEQRKYEKEQRKHDKKHHKKHGKHHDD